MPKGTRASPLKAKPLGRGAECQPFGASALCSNPLTEEEKNFFASSHWSYILAILKALAPLGAGASVIAPLPERLLGLIDGSL